MKVLRRYAPMLLRGTFLLSSENRILGDKLLMWTCPLQSDLVFWQRSLHISILALFFANVVAPVAELAGGTATSATKFSPVSDTVRIYETSGKTQANRPISIPRAFHQGEIPQFAQASINGNMVLTQCDVKNRWPDGSLKFAIVSFVIPNLPGKGSVVASFSNQAT